MNRKISEEKNNVVYKAIKIVVCIQMMLVFKLEGQTKLERLNSRSRISLNGIWNFSQTIKAYPPESFERTVQVPGLIHLTKPVFEDYSKFLVKKSSNIPKAVRFDAYNLDYEPKYSWYRKEIFIPKDLADKEVYLTLKKSQFVTQIYVNGQDFGSSMACFTPKEAQITRAVKFGSINEVLIRVGDRNWLPIEAAGGNDREKEHYLPGIWDDVELSFTGKFRANRVLVLPSVLEKAVLVKLKVLSLCRIKLSSIVLRLIQSTSWYL